MLKTRMNGENVYMTYIIKHRVNISLIPYVEIYLVVITCTYNSVKELSIFTALWTKKKVPNFKTWDDSYVHPSKCSDRL